jgi:signal transduction histidine kinase
VPRWLTRSRHQLVWPLLLLAVSFGATALTAWQAHRAAGEHRRSAERLLREYAGFAAWSYTRHAEDALGEAAWMVVNPILHRHPHELTQWPDALDLVEYWRHSVEMCVCTPTFRPESFFAFALGADTLGTAGAPMPPALQRWVNARLTARLRDRAAPPERLGLTAARVDGMPRFVGYGLMPMARGDTMVYGFTVDPATIPALFRDAFEHKLLLPATVTHGLANEAILAVRVAAPDGTLLYQSAGWPSWDYVADDVVRPAGGGLIVRAAVRPALAAEILHGNLPSSRPPLFIGLMLLLSAGFTVLAVRQIRREGELAALRSDFVASVSHELRTPLAQIRLFLETLRLRRFSTDEQREWLLQHLDRETTRLAHLVENVLAFSRLERGTAAPAGPLAPADVVAEIATTVRDFEPLAASRRVTLRTALEDAPGAPLVAPLDRAAFRQLLLNLLDNAVKYGPTGQTVTVRAARRDGLVRVAVEDAGPGIAAAEREWVFEPFHRGREAAARVVGGSGIGLALVRDIAARHGGRVRLEDVDPRSATAPGLRVVVELPGAEGHSSGPPDKTDGADGADLIQTTVPAEDMA